MAADTTAAQEAAFHEWRVLRERAIETGDRDDALASAKAFADFHYLFIETTMRPSDKVVPFPIRHHHRGGGDDAA